MSTAPDDADPPAADQRAARAAVLDLPNDIKKLRNRAALLFVVINNAPLVLFGTDASGVIRFSRGKALEALGLEQDELVGQSVFDLYVNEPAVADSARRALAGELVTARLHLDGVVHETRFGPIRDRDGNIAGMLGVAIDITERARAEDDLERRALFDEVTGLPNRQAFRDAVDTEIGRQEAVAPFAVLDVGLDRFRDVNSTYGFDYGDRVLEQVGHRLGEALGDHALVAKLGGDEYGILVRHPSSIGSADALGAHVIAAFEEPVVVDDEPIAIEASVGIALYPGHGNSGDLLMRRANTALHVAKGATAAVAGYRRERDEPRINNVQLLRELREAIEDDQLLLHYQPKVRLSDGSVAGVEALIRWQHPTRGMLQPAAFIPLSERTGVVRRLAPWVIERALKRALTLQAGGRSALPIAVNLSARSFQDRALPDRVGGLLDLWGVPGQQLEIEITETAIMSDPERAREICARLRDLGIRIAIDDFGTGHSPLVYLQRLGVHAMKIDISFVRDLGRSAENQAIVQAIIDLGKRLEVETVAEGVEDAPTYERLLAMGCDQVQGFHVSCPMSGDDLLRWRDARN